MPATSQHLYLEKRKKIGITHLVCCYLDVLNKLNK